MTEHHSGRGQDAAAVMGLLWETLIDLMGSAATATLLRRAAKRGTSQRPEMVDFSITKSAFEYRYAVPPSWKDGHDRAALAGLHELARQLRPLLAELTGAVVLRRLDAIPELK